MDPKNLNWDELKELRQKALSKGQKVIVELAIALRKSAYNGSDLEHSGFTVEELAAGGFREYWAVKDYFWHGIPKPVFFKDRWDCRKWWLSGKLPTWGERTVDDRLVEKLLSFGIPLELIFLSYNYHFPTHIYAHPKKIRHFIDQWNLPLKFLGNLLSNSHWYFIDASWYEKKYLTQAILDSCTIAECRTAGIDIISIYAAKKDLPGLIKTGAPISSFQEIFLEKKITTNQLFEAGYSFIDLLSLGADWQEVRNLGAKVEDFKQADILIFRLVPLYGKDRMFSWMEIVHAYGLQQIRQIYLQHSHQFPFDELLAGGIALSQLREAGFKPFELYRWGRQPVEALLKAGFQPKELRKALEKEGDSFLRKSGLQPIGRLGKLISGL